MAIGKNVAKVERVIRIILGVILILESFLVTGFWKVACIVVGVLFLATATVGY